ncbi:MAG: class II aldolase/adducin family protein [Desulfobacterales bacterium]|nr:class II aldolase/adducin family protein [Desulfobacterales bacterium]
MEELVLKYADKLIRAGLAESSGPHQPLVGGLDDTLVWNRRSSDQDRLEQVFSGLNINSLVCLRPVQPYAGLLRYLCSQALSSNGLIRPKDCETRTFLHDLPVIDRFAPDRIVSTLKRRKSVIILEEEPTGASVFPAIIAPGTVSPEQGFVTVSSVCFAGFIKFFTDYLAHLKLKTVSTREHGVFDSITGYIRPLPENMPAFNRAPFKKESDVYDAVIEAGLKTVEYDLVDSYFGNVSCCWKDTLYISQTASSLDELSGCIDPVPLDHSTSAGLTASSELSAHLKTIEITGNSAILHGHPKFSVILSMDCDPVEKADCPFRDRCHTHCPKTRFIEQTPIVPGEVGTGPTGLCHTLPRALSRSDSAIVYGHGLFTTGKHDFHDAFQSMLDVETRCRKNYFDQVAGLRSGGQTLRA